MAMTITKGLTTKGVITLYEKNKKKVKLTVRKLDRDTILIEGSETTLEFLGHLLVAHAQEKDDCHFYMSPKNPGSYWFSKYAQFGIYFHRLPCAQKRPLYQKRPFKKQ